MNLNPLKVGLKPSEQIIVILCITKEINKTNDLIVFWFNNKYSSENSTLLQTVLLRIRIL